MNNENITNAMLKTIIDVIEVDSDSNVEVRLKLLNEIGNTPTVITNFNEIQGDIKQEAEDKSKKSNKKSTVTKSNISTQRCNTQERFENRTSYS